MYNLLISGSGWNEKHDTMLGGRIFDYTSEELVARFKPNGKPDFDAVCKFPALLASERSSTSEPARVATITRVRPEGRDYALDYVIDHDIPPIPADVFEDLGRELGIAGSKSWEWNNTHWAIKDVDLYEVLLRHHLGKTRKPKPTAFSFTDDRDDKLVAVMMPFAPEFKSVYAAIGEAADGAGLRWQRADDIWVEHTIIQEIINLICRARIVVCDLSRKNPNVLYEAGIAHSLGKDVVLLAQSIDDVPFDLRAHRALTYYPNGEGLSEMKAVLQKRLETLMSR